jgi:MAF protein
MTSDPSALEITLASASPRRHELMGLTGWGFTVCSLPIPETPRQGETPEGLATRLALSKASAARKSCPDTAVIFAADTLVIHNGGILGKPTDATEAVSMLQDLRGQWHNVITVITLQLKDQIALHALCESRVPLRNYADDEIRAYVDGGSPLDKAGAYGIQDPEFHPVDIELFSDCFANVMGLPLCHLVRTMGQLGYDPPNDVPEHCMQFTGYGCTIYRNILRGEL